MDDLSDMTKIEEKRLNDVEVFFVESCQDDN